MAMQFVRVVRNGRPVMVPNFLGAMPSNAEDGGGAQLWTDQEGRAQYRDYLEVPPQGVPGGNMGSGPYGRARGRGRGRMAIAMPQTGPGWHIDQATGLLVRDVPGAPVTPTPGPLPKPVDTTVVTGAPAVAPGFFASITGWVTANPWLAAGLGIGVYFLFFSKGR